MLETNNNPKTIAIVGGTLWGNRGAEAMLATSIGQIRQHYPDARFRVFSYYPTKDGELCLDSEIEFHNLKPLNLGLKVFPVSFVTWLFSKIGIRLPDSMLPSEVVALRDSDALLDVGGITFCDGREIFLLYNVLSVLPAMLFKVPVVKMSQAMGPFENPINRFCAIQIMKRCARVFARGGKTVKHLKQINLPKHKWASAADIAFTFEDRFCFHPENAEKVESMASELRQAECDYHQTVAIVPSSLVTSKNENYVPTLVSLTLDIIAAGNRVILLPNATREGSDKLRNNDLASIAQIVKSLAANHPDALQHVSSVDFDVNTAAIRRLMRFADVVVTSRFHGMIAALSESIPTVVIGWSHKYREVLQQFGCEELCFDHQSSESGTLTEQVLNVLANHTAYKEKIAASGSRVFNSSQSQFDFVNTFLASLPCDGKSTDSSTTRNKPIQHPTIGA